MVAVSLSRIVTIVSPRSRTYVVQAVAFDHRRPSSLSNIPVRRSHPKRPVPVTCVFLSTVNVYAFTPQSSDLTTTYAHRTSTSADVCHSVTSQHTNETPLRSTQLSSYNLLATLSSYRRRPWLSSSSLSCRMQCEHVQFASMKLEVAVPTFFHHILRLFLGFEPMVSSASVCSSGLVSIAIFRVLNFCGFR